MTKEITQAVKSSVNAYLMARTLAECEREKIDKIGREILESATYHIDPKFLIRGRESHRITDPGETWMLKTEEFHDYLVDLKKAMQDAGYKIKSIPGEPEYSYNCPALTAESLQRDTEHLLVEAMAEMIGEKDDLVHNLICAGLEKYHQFIDLVVKMVVNAPGFKNPLTGKTI